LTNPKVLIRPHQAESAEGKNVIIGEEKPERMVLQNQTSRAATKASTLGGGKAGKKKPTENQPV